MRLAYFAAFAAAALLTSCSPQLTFFDKDLYDTQKWSDDDLKRIQFYLSEDLTIYRYLDEESGTTITSGQIKMVDGRKTEQIFFPQRTPGVFLYRPKDEHFAISFEGKGDKYFLTFGPNPRYSGQYMLLATEWDHKTGKVTYAGRKFYTQSNEIPRLMVDLKRENRTSTDSRKAGGRTVKQ